MWQVIQNGSVLAEYGTFAPAQAHAQQFTGLVVWYSSQHGNGKLGCQVWPL